MCLQKGTSDPPSWVIILQGIEPVKTSGDLIAAKSSVEHLYAQAVESNLATALKYLLDALSGHHDIRYYGLQMPNFGQVTNLLTTPDTKPAAKPPTPFARSVYGDPADDIKTSRAQTVPAAKPEQVYGGLVGNPTPTEREMQDYRRNNLDARYASVVHARTPTAPPIDVHSSDDSLPQIELPRRDEYPATTARESQRAGKPRVPVGERVEKHRDFMNANANHSEYSFSFENVRLVMSASADQLRVISGKIEFQLVEGSVFDRFKYSGALVRNIGCAGDQPGIISAVFGSTITKENICDVIDAFFDRFAQ
jgi:hypothetical protein